MFITEVQERTIRDQLSAAKIRLGKARDIIETGDVDKLAYVNSEIATAQGEIDRALANITPKE